MNTRQKWMLILTAVILLGMLLFPPFQAQVQGTVYNLGYHYLAAPPRRGSISASVNIPMLLVQWLGVALVGAIALLLLKGPQRGAAPAAGSHQPLPDSVAPPAVNQSRTFLGGHHHPWRRYFARLMDVILFGLAAGAALRLVSPSFAELAGEPGTAVWLGIFGLLAMVPVEAALISLFETTPGKWVFGIEVVGEDGAPLPFGTAAVRALRVWVQGFWCGLPVVSIAPMVLAYGRLTRTGTTLWDTSCHAVVTHRPWTPARAIGATATTLFVWVLFGLVTKESHFSSPSVQATSGVPGTQNSEPSGQQPPATPATAETDEYEWAPEVHPSWRSTEAAQTTPDAGDAASNTAEDEWAQFPIVRARASEQPAQQPPATQVTAETYENAYDAYRRGDYMTALKWYRLAAEQGVAIAQFNLGVMYADGQGVPQDYVQAHKWFNLAAARFPASEAENRNSAVNNRDHVAALMTPAQVAEAQRLVRGWRPKPGGD